MRKLIRLIILGIVIAVTWKYLDEKSISAKDLVIDSIDWVKEKVDEAKAFIEQEAGDAKTYIKLEAGEAKAFTEQKADEARAIIEQKAGEGRSSLHTPGGDRMESVITSSRIGQSTARPVAAPPVTRRKTPNTEPGEPLIIEAADQKAAALMEINDLFEWVKEATRIYSPDTWHMLMEYDGLPLFSETTLACGGSRSMGKSTSTFHYLRGNTRSELLLRMSVNVHEIAHGYYRHNVFRYEKENDIPGYWDNISGYIYLTPFESYYVTFPGEQLFPSRELATRIPNSLRTFRFATYITGKTSTQSEGVFGLLNELHAYYLGSKNKYDMLEAYKLATGNYTRGVIDWIRNSKSSMAALFEFDYFIMEYLLHMRDNYPSHYAQLRGYEGFSTAYAAVRSIYVKLVSEYFETIAAEMDRINKSDTHRAEIREGYFWVTELRSGRSTGAKIISEDKYKLLPVLKSDRYSEVERDFAVNM